jgi:leucyl aminopeptidase
MAERAHSLASDQLTVEIWDEARIRDAGMGGIIGVGQGSTRPPCLIHCHYRPSGTPRRTIALVGKGVTFDSGGLSIKPSSGMLTMRCDMAGGATVLGVMRAIRDIQPDVEVHGIVGAVENMTGGDAMKLGDILHMHNGKTVEVHNTDAEGRLVLADCLSFASSLGVDQVVDIATLTGAVVVALGEDFTGLFTGDEEIASGLLESAETTGEGLWRLPLHQAYKKKLKAEWADLKNLGDRWGGSITAALFLSEFVDGPQWAHLDIAGPAFHERKHGHFASGATGTMVSTLTDWVSR